MRPPALPALPLVDSSNTDAATAVEAAAIIGAAYPFLHLPMPLDLQANLATFVSAHQHVHHQQQHQQQLQHGHAATMDINTSTEVTSTAAARTTVIQNDDADTENAPANAPLETNDENQATGGTRSKSSHRRSFTNSFRLQVVEYAKRLSVHEAAQEFHVAESMVSRWTKHEAKLRQTAGSRRRIGNPGRPRKTAANLFVVPLDPNTAPLQQEQ